MIKTAVTCAEKLFLTITRKLCFRHLKRISNWNGQAFAHLNAHTNRLHRRDNHTSAKRKKEKRKKKRQKARGDQYRK
jgi:hypothetical protein